MKYSKVIVCILGFISVRSKKKTNRLVNSVVQQIMDA